MTTGKPIILIVDDAPSSVALLGSILQEDYHIKVASDGEGALAIALRPPRPDLILLDVLMPGMDGLEVCRRLKSNPETMNIPVIFVTSQSDESDEEIGLKLGAVDYIIKPISIPIARARIRNHILLKQQADLLEQSAKLDALTQIPNRRQFDERCDTEWKRATRDGSELSLLMIDIDYFKEFNDHYGHSAGDKCLQWVAKVLHSGALRSGDLVARVGGEEFAAILPHTGREAALQIAEGLRKKVLALEITHGYSKAAPVVTVSIGSASTVPAGDVKGAPFLLDEADRNLYLAKEKGRNRVI